MRTGSLDRWTVMTTLATALLLAAIAPSRAQELRKADGWGLVRVVEGTSTENADGLTTSAQATRPTALESLDFLLGTWEAAGEGQPGAGSGKAVFSRDLQDRVMIRRSFAEYPASARGPASRHDDSMVIYATAAGGIRADYYDNEGHVIRYAVSSPAPGSAVFVSDIVAGEPRYRLSYTRGLNGLVKGEFAIAAPGKADTFQTYLSWESRRTDR
jgi:hypothetical protein